MIQTNWRASVRRKSAKKWRKQMLVVHRTLRKWIVRWRVQRKRKAADMIYNFLIDLQDVNRIVQVIRRFRFWGNRKRLALTHSQSPNRRPFGGSSSRFRRLSWSSSRTSGT